MLQSAEQVCVVGIGCCTAVGNDAPSTAAAVRAGVAGFREHPFMISQDGEPYILAMAPAVDPSIIGPQRLIELAIHAADEACMPMEGLHHNGPAVPVLVGLPEYRPGMDGNLESELAAALRLRCSAKFAVGDIKTAAKGHTAGLMAIESAGKLLRQRKSEFCLAGGVDSYIDPDTLDWVEDNEQLHKPDNAWGFIPGEAAGFCLMCTEATAIQYTLPIMARVVAVAHSVEKNCIKTETVCIGEGLTKAIATVMKELPADQKIQQTYCDQNGEAYRADEFGFMLARLSEQFEDPSMYIAPADCWGDVGAASGPLFVNLHIAATHKGYAKGVLCILWASSEGGERSAAILNSHTEATSSN